jgi:hypothetical protein
LKSLRSGHPRLLVLDQDLPRVRELVKTDSTAQLFYRRLKELADQLLTEPPLTYRANDQGHLLWTSRRAEGRILNLAGLYRLEGDKRYAQRAIAEMLAVCRFEHWHPPHFLDTAEMTAATAIGYDWLYDVLTPAQRDEVAGAIVRLGLREGEKIYQKKSWWAVGNNNWNQVCNGGLTIGALAVAEREPALAASIVASARESIQIPLKLFAPDGGFAEGPIYWNYALNYTTLYLNAISTALGTDFGIGKAKGLDVTGWYHMHMLSPTWREANFADAAEAVEGAAPQMFWLANEYRQPAYAAFESEFMRHARFEESRFAMLGLLWMKEAPGAFGSIAAPLGARFERIAVATFRSAWGDPEAWWVAFKGGSGRASHGHLDLGSFVLESQGERWAIDLGPDSYSLPGYFGRQRWDYYRTRTEGHNTLMVDDQNESTAAEAPLTAFRTSRAGSMAVADLVTAYADKLKSWKRGMRLQGSEYVLLQDEVEAKAGPVKLTWAIHTRARATVGSDQTVAMLESGGKKLRLRILSPRGAAFAVHEVPNPQAPQRPIRGVSKVSITMPGQVRTTIAVVMDKGAAGSPAVVPLTNWE